MQTYEINKNFTTENSLFSFNSKLEKNVYSLSEAKENFEETELDNQIQKLRDRRLEQYRNKISELCSQLGVSKDV